MCDFLGIWLLECKCNHQATWCMVLLFDQSWLLTEASKATIVTRIIVIDLMHPIRFLQQSYLFFGPSSLASRVQFEEPKFILMHGPTMDHSQNILGENSCSSSYKSNRSWDGISELFVDETGKECWCTNTWVLNYRISPCPFCKLTTSAFGFKQKLIFKYKRNGVLSQSRPTKTPYVSETISILHSYPIAFRVLLPKGEACLTVSHLIKQWLPKNTGTVLDRLYSYPMLLIRSRLLLATTTREFRTESSKNQVSINLI